MLGHTDNLLEASLASLLAMAGAGAIHWGLRRIGRRLPLLLRRRSGGSIESSRVMRWEAVIEGALLLPKAAVWLGAIAYVSDQFALLQMA